MSFKRYKGIKGKAWTMLSKYIRARDQGICITCGRPARGSRYHAGHFIPVGGRLSNNKLAWDEKNIYGQCEDCNKWKDGNVEKFEEVLIKRYGQEFVDELKARKWKIDPIKDWQAVYNYYKDKFEKLTCEKQL